MAARRWPPIEDRLMARRAIQPNGCWHSTIGIQRKGYAHIFWNGRTQGIHRVSYQLYVGPISAGLTVNHKCHDDDPGCPGGPCLHRRCFNPAHLEAVTHKKNLDNGKTPAAMNAARTHCNYGHEFTLANTYIRADGGRQCRRCGADRGRAKRAARGLQQPRTECAKGHPFDTSNTYIDPVGGRHCRTCKREYMRATRRAAA